MNFIEEVINILNGDGDGDVIDILALQQALGKFTETESLSLINQEINEFQAQVLAENIEHFNGNGLCIIGSYFGAEGAKAIAKSFANFKGKVLELNSNDIGDEGAKAIAEALANFKGEVLELGSNNIGDEGAKAIAAGFVDFKGLDLDLSSNDIGDEGAKAIAAGFANFKGRSLDISTNDIGDEGAKAIAAGFANFKGEVLDLSSSGIGDEGAKAIAAGFANFKGRSLDLSYNDVKGGGAQYIADNLKYFKGETLNLSGNPFENGLISISKVFKDFAINELCLRKTGATLNDLWGFSDKLDLANIQRLVIGDMDLQGERGVECINKLFRKFKGKSLDFVENNLDADCKKALLENIIVFTGKELDISENSIEDAGAVFIAENLSKINRNLSLHLDEKCASHHEIEFALNKLYEEKTLNGLIICGSQKITKLCLDYNLAIKRERTVSFCMGAHHRLGQNSTIFLRCNQDIMNLIAQKADLVSGAMIIR